MAFPDAVGLVVAYLGDVVDPVTVHSEVPKTRPDRFVQVRRVGGPAATVRDVARLDIFAWAATAPEAMQLSNTVRSAIWALSGTTELGPVVYAVSEFMGSRQNDDEETGTPRVWTTYEVAIRADDAIQPAPNII